MRKLLLIALFIVAIGLTGCGEKIDPAAEEVMKDIETIGEVTVTDEDLINRISEAYDKLTAEQKAQVTNYDELEDAKEKLEEAKVQEQKEYEEWLESQMQGQPQEPEENDEELYKMDLEDEMKEEIEEQKEAQMEEEVEESSDLPDLE